MPPSEQDDEKALWIVPKWIERHCTIPDGFNMGQPWVLYDWQWLCTVRHYQLKPTAEVGQLAPAFKHRRSLVVAPQKMGKGPWSATITLAEAAGPVVFYGWAAGGEVYACSDWGCGCGWLYEYEPGEGMGRPWPTPLIQLLATSEDQVDNVYRPLQSMVRQGPLADMMKVGEEFTRVGTRGRIDVVTSNAQSRLGNPITFAMQDESGLYNDTNKMRKVAETMRRGLAGMGGRSLETTNPPDPSEDSVAQRTLEGTSKDIFRFWRDPPKHLSFKDKRERRKILQYVYRGADHIDIDSIDAEAAELMETDAAQAERFFGNRMVYGAGAWCETASWDDRGVAREVLPDTPIVVGFDGADVDDWTALRCETQDGHQFTPEFDDGTPMIWNPAMHGGQVPRLEVHAAVEHLFETFRVARFYGDPPYWETELDEWAEKYGEKIVVRWSTYRIVQMHAASERLLTDVNKQDSGFTHDGCPTTAAHVRNARKAPRPQGRYVLAKPSNTQKIDACVTSVICHEAAGDVTAAKLWPTRYRVFMA